MVWPCDTNFIVEGAGGWGPRAPRDPRGAPGGCHRHPEIWCKPVVSRLGHPPSTPPDRRRKDTTTVPLERLPGVSGVVGSPVPAPSGGSAGLPAVSMGNSAPSGVARPCYGRSWRALPAHSAVLDGAAWLRLGTSTGAAALYYCETRPISCPNAIALKPNRYP